jgi:hypothetical protein
MKPLLSVIEQVERGKSDSLVFRCDVHERIVHSG